MTLRDRVRLVNQEVGPHAATLVLQRGFNNRNEPFHLTLSEARAALPYWTQPDRLALAS